MEGLKIVEGQLTKKEKRLKTALEIAQDLVDKRLNLINWERRLKKHEQSINEIANRIGGLEDSSMINQQNENDGSFIGSIFESFFGKKDNENDYSSSKLRKGIYTEEDWEKILVRLTPAPSSYAPSVVSMDDDELDGKIDENVRNSRFAENNQQKQNKEDECLNEAKGLLFVNVVYSLIFYEIIHAK